MSVRIAIISDLHFGFGRNTERENDCWEVAEEAFEKARDCDLIVIPGDIFDDKIPRPDEWANSMKILSGVNVPMVAIHGTHERRGKGLINSVEALDYAGFLKHIHCGSACYEIKGRKIVVHGMSGVPESYAKEVLDEWNPKPEKDSFNIFMLHQSIHPYIYNPVEPPSLSLEDLPKGFDLYISGHIHWREKTNIMGKPFIIPGSTVTTQVNKTEAKFSKGFYIVELNDDVDIKFVELNKARKVLYKDFKINNDKISDVMDKIDKYLSGIKEDKKPLVRIKVVGNLDKGNELNFYHLKEKYRKKMFLYFSTKISENELEKKVKMLKDIRERKASVEEMGMRILRENMKEVKLSSKYEEVFDLLVEKNIDSAMLQLLSEEEEKADTDKNDFSDEKKKGLLAWSK